MPRLQKRFVRGLLDDYAFTALACLDAYEVTGAMSYFKFAQQIADEMVRRFGDATSGGFFDTEASSGRKAATGRALGAAQAVSGCAHSGRQSQRGDCAVALARLHQRREVSRQSRRHTRGLCRDGGAVRHLCRNLWNCGDLDVAAAHPGGRGRRRREGGGAAAGCNCARSR